MVNIIWFLLLGSGIITAAIKGNIEIITIAALDSAKMAVKIAVDLVGLMALWLGLLKIAEDSGLVKM